MYILYIYIYRVTYIVKTPTPSIFLHDNFKGASAEYSYMVIRLRINNNKTNEIQCRKNEIVYSESVYNLRVGRLSYLLDIVLYMYLYLCCVCIIQLYTS